MPWLDPDPGLLIVYLIYSVHLMNIGTIPCYITGKKLDNWDETFTLVNVDFNPPSQEREEWAPIFLCFSDNDTCFTDVFFRFR